MDNILSERFVELTRMLFNTGYSFLVGIHYPGLNLTPLVLLLTGSAVIASIRFIRKVLVEV